MRKTQVIRELLRSARPLVSPGIYDGYSLRLVEAMGFKTAATTGSGVVGIDEQSLNGVVRETEEAKRCVSV